jgi:hypothetical protein
MCGITMYETIYSYLCRFSNFKIHGMLFCRLLAPVVLIVLLWISRIVSSFTVKIFAVGFALILYFLPSVINIFVV